MITVHHLKDYAERQVDFLFKECPDKMDLYFRHGHRYEVVAVVDVADYQPDEAFRLTNNIDKNWAENGKVFPTPSVMERGGCRNTSVGDVLVLSNGRRLLLSSYGWKRF